MNLIMTLESLGYRRVKTEHPIFAKPMGFCIVFVNEQTGEIWSQIKRADNGESVCWSEGGSINLLQDVDDIRMDAIESELSDLLDGFYEMKKAA